MIWLVIGLILLIGGAEYFSLIRLPQFVDAECRLLTRTAEPGRPFRLRTVFRNHSWLPVTLLVVTERIPPAAVLMSPGADGSVREQTEEERTPDSRTELDATGARLSYKTWLMPRQQLTKELLFTISRRGCYVFRGTSLFVGDFAGLKGSVRLFDRHEEIVIYPAPSEGEELENILGGYLGEIPVRRFILEDPVLTAGLSEYTGREPMRAINWKQTARSLQTMVNLYDHTTDFSAAVILNLGYTSRYETDQALLESTLSLARGVIEALERRRIRYSFLSNMLTAGSIGEWQYVPEGLGTAHMSGILEGLGRATLDISETPGRLLERAQQIAGGNRAYILITPEGGEKDKDPEGYMEELKTGVEQIRIRSGQPVLVLAAGEGGIRRWS